jgi:CRP-like cAMP-binding protein
MADKKVDHLADTWLFSTLSRKELARLARVCDEVEVPSGRVLVKEGDFGREFFLIRSGQATVKRRGRKVASLKPGQYFGELSLLSRLPRNATITADSDMDLLVMGQREFSAAIEDVPTIAHKMLEAMARRLSESDSK